MNYNKILIACLCAGIVFGCSKEQSSETLQEEIQQQEDNSALIKGVLEVEFSAEPKLFLTKTAPSLTDLNITRIERVFPEEEDPELEARHRQWGMHLFYNVYYDNTVAPTKALKSLEGLEDVVNVVIPRKKTVCAKPYFNDPYLYNQWHYYNDGTYNDKCIAGCDINVAPVWERYTGGSSDVIVCVVDTGVDMDHEDLGPIVIPAGENGSRNCYYNNYIINPGEHGTHVAGTIAAINNNGKGVCGIAGGLDGKGGVKVMSCDVATEDGHLAGTARAITWGADHGAVICQNSWGSSFDNEEDAKSYSFGGSEKTSIDYFIANAGIDVKGKQTGPMKGGVVIFAAGNDGWSVGWPAKYSPCIAVGAIGPAFNKADYSNYGDWVDICAPGGGGGALIYSCKPGNSYQYLQGTSMACPHVSGVAALLVSQFGGPGFTVEKLEEYLLGGASTDKVKPGAKIGKMLDAFGSFSYGGTKAPAAVANPSVQPAANNIDFTFPVTADPEDGTAWSYKVFVSSNLAAMEGLDPDKTNKSITIVEKKVGDLKVGDNITIRVPDLEFEHQYYAIIYAYDYAKHYSKTDIISVKTTKNNPPTIKILREGDVKVKSHLIDTVPFMIVDPDGHTINLDVDPGSDALVVSPNELTGNTDFIITAKNALAGQYTAKIKATDSYGAEATYDFVYEILENNKPIIKKQLDNQILTYPGQKMSFDMNDYIEDPDGETLSYTFKTSTAGIVHLTSSLEGNLMLTALDYGMVSLTVTANDCKSSTNMEFKALVYDEDAGTAQIYPNPVVDYLNISAGAQKTFDIQIFNATGAQIYNGQLTGDAFDPAKIDMSACAPGKYQVNVVSDKLNVIKSIVKK